ncbi:IS200/IS605 family transposase [Streptosporangium canum]|uniref:IS200/IS605 family transposase n=1 Tax=Streptosporangium canum TaxID=324952 RepID=UPI003425B5E8
MIDRRESQNGRHCVFVPHAHLVFATRFPHEVLTATHLNRMEKIMRDVCADFETELREFNSANNHLHLLVNFPPKIALSKLVSSWIPLEASLTQKCSTLDTPREALLPEAHRALRWN